MKVTAGYFALINGEPQWGSYATEASDVMGWLKRHLTVEMLRNGGVDLKICHGGQKEERVYDTKEAKLQVNFKFWIGDMPAEMH